MREQKLYNNNYNGLFYEVFEGDIHDVRETPINRFSIEPVSPDELISGGLYVIENGRIVKYVDEDMYIPMRDTELVTGNIYSNLTKRQLKLFWTIVKIKEEAENGVLC